MNCKSSSTQSKALSQVGARWWKVDFHAHSPGSVDYGKGKNQNNLQEISPRDWLLDFMAAEIDCVVLTDHNSGVWIDKVKEALEQLEQERPPGYRKLILFPGVELSVQGGIHILGLFSEDCSTSDVDRLVGAVGYRGSPGDSDSVTEKSPGDVATEIHRHGGIPIPAHVDLVSYEDGRDANGLFKLSGQTLSEVLANKSILAMEVVDREYVLPDSYRDHNPEWTRVLGSDSHRPRSTGSEAVPGSRYTWVKMGKPTLDGVRLALVDGKISVTCSDEVEINPNRHSALVIRELSVIDAKYIGRRSKFNICLNPWLNAVIGGRGTGKSTLVEFLRVVLDRRDEIMEPLIADLEKYWRISSNRQDDGLMTQHTQLECIYEKDGTQFRLSWNPEVDEVSIEEYNGSSWVPTEGDVRQRFPVRIFSQKQIYQMARNPRALIEIIDQSKEVRNSDWYQRRRSEEAQFMTLRAKIREMREDSAEESRLRGELADVVRRLRVFEDAGHGEILKEFSKRQRQLETIENWETSLAMDGEHLRATAEKIMPPQLSTVLVPEDDESREIGKTGDVIAQRFVEMAKKVTDLSNELDGFHIKWKEKRLKSRWQAAVDKASQDYNALKDRLKVEGIEDPHAFEELVKRRQELERRLSGIKEKEKQVERLAKEAESCFERIESFRQGLSEARGRFLSRVLEDNRYVDIEVLPYASTDTAEPELRRLLSREGGGFEKDIGEPDQAGTLVGDLFAHDKTSKSFETAIKGLKDKLSQIHAQGASKSDLKDARFGNHVERLQSESLDRLALWFLEDSLRVRYSPTGDGQNFRPIETGSPGQQTAALLAFLLSHGKEPLILDQPEDDLDNHLIYDLIVRQIRNMKSQRQIIVVTHNANIVVNGDAELVVALKAGGNETLEEAKGSLQERDVRSTICHVMEGGKKAFQQRYQRISLERLD